MNGDVPDGRVKTLQDMRVDPAVRRRVIAVDAFATHDGGQSFDASPGVAPSRRLALCVDDFGLHLGVNEAVFRLAALRRVSATSCLVDAPAFAIGAKGLIASDCFNAGDVDIGLHLNLTESFDADADASRPLRPMPLPLLIARCYTRSLPAALLRAEIERQLTAFEAALGRAPDYVDGHQHVHQFPQVRDALIEVLLRRYPAHRPWLRRTRVPSGLRHSGLKARVIAGLGDSALARRARAAGFAQNERLLGVYGFEINARNYEMHARDWLARCQDGDLWMSHASVHSTTLDPLLPARLREFQWLSSRAFGHALAMAGVVLAPVRPPSAHR
ncbi:MAG: hypothetical protein JWP52_4374 [Rhizobacter sp.]|nr:hypothetical protein [Rhizobacter sp.]